MAITVTQGFEYGDTDNDNSSTTWVIQCHATDTPNNVHDALLAAVPSAMGILLLSNVKVKHILDTLYLGEATYKRAQARDKVEEDAGYVLDFDTTGQTQHINHSLGYESYVASGDSVEDCQGVIGFDGEKVKGVDIVVGVYNFAEEWTLDATVVTSTYRKNLAYLTGKVNSDAFRTFSAGEVLFLGATGRRIKGDKFSVTFKFAVSQNATDLECGDITVSEKSGWEYMDVRYRDKLTGDLMDIIQSPKQVNIQQVYKTAAFSSFFPSA